MSTNSDDKIVVAARIENIFDLHEVNFGVISADRARVVEVEDALVDLNATRLALPKRLIDQLGLCPVKWGQGPSISGIQNDRFYETVRLTVLGHDCLTDVTELPDDGPVRIGALTIEHLDLVVDLMNHRLIGNPAHGGEQILEKY